MTSKKAIGNKKVPSKDRAGMVTARTLTEALPYLQRYAGRTIAIKYGGHAMGDEALRKSFAKDLVLIKQLGANPVVIHGGGPQIAEMLKRLAIKSSFVDGLRVTDEDTVEVVEMVLAGSINKAIVSDINQAGGQAVGLSGKDGTLIVAEKLRRTVRDPESQIERHLDLGFVGEPKKVNPAILETILQSDLIPVIAPIGIGEAGETYNINADTAAGAVAAALNAARFILLTDMPGVLSKKGDLITNLSRAEAENLIQDGTISGGMIPKVETCLESLNQGVEAAVIVDGRVGHALLLEIYTEHGVGTLISDTS